MRALPRHTLPTVFAYDSQVRAALQAQPSSIAEVITAMQAIDALTTDGDGLKWFNRLYLSVTETVGARIASHGFTDAAFMADLDVRFAGLYFSALSDFLAGSPLPGCWQVLFAVRGDQRLARIQCALAGMNAHINHDLAFAIVSTCQARGIAPDDDSVQHRDFTALNTTLDSLIETAKAELDVRLLGDALPPLGFLEDTIAGWSMSAARQNAWNNAEVLWNIRGLPPLRDRFAHGLDGVASVIGKALLVPVP
jgi:hypothetical protein